MKNYFRTILGAMVLAALSAGIGLAGQGQEQKKLNQEYPVISAPVNEQAQAPVQAVEQAAGGKKGTVTPIPLDNLKAERFKTGDGKTGWRVTVPGNRALTTPAVVDGMVFVGGGFGSYEFYAFDATTGRPRWAIRVSDDGPTAAVVDDGVVVFNTESCTLFVVDARSGKMLWSRWLGDPLMSQPAIAGGMVFMAFPGPRSHELIALGLKDGLEKWRAGLEGDIISAPVVYKKSVYLTTFDGNVYRFRTKNGDLVWKKDFRATSAPWLFKDQVFVSQREPGDDQKPMEGVLRMENKQGEQNQTDGSWNKKAAPYLDAKIQARSSYNTAQKSDDASVGFSSGPASAKLGAAEANVGQGTVRGLWEYQGSRPCVYDGVLYLTQGDQVVALDPDSGKELWSRDLSGDLEKIGGHLAAPPSPAGDSLYLATATGKVVVLDRKKGRTKDTIEIGSPMRFQPALARGRLFVGTTDGVLVSIDLADAGADGWTMWGGGPEHNGQ
jgi:Ca-activated chloride channel family protein